MSKGKWITEYPTTTVDDKDKRIESLLNIIKEIRREICKQDHSYLLQVLDNAMENYRRLNQ